MLQLRCATVIVAACLLSGCATMRVSSHTERGLSWSQYRTFEWGQADRFRRATHASRRIRTSVIASRVRSNDRWRPTASSAPPRQRHRIC